MKGGEPHVSTRYRALLPPTPLNHYTKHWHRPFLAGAFACKMTGMANEYHKLTDEEKAFFEKWYGQMKVKAFQRSFARRFGQRITLERLRQYASRHRLNEVPPNYYSVTELSELVPYKPESIRLMIYSGKLKARLCGHKILVPAKEAVRFIEECEGAIPPWPAIKVKEAAEAIGFCVSSSGGGQSSITKAAKKYSPRLPIVKFKNARWIPRRLFELICEQLERTGSARVDWESVISEYESENKAEGKVNKDEEVQCPGDSLQREYL